jgi:outer membrane lipoprotein carrier protein
VVKKDNRNLRGEGRKMKKLITILFVLTGIISYSQVKDQKAIALLDEVSNKTKSCKSIKVDFSYTMENKQAKINESKSGTLLISGDKYRLTAAGQTVISDGTTIWTYIKESNEVQINTLDNKDDAMTPSKLLTSYNSNYKSRIIKNKNIKDPNIESVELLPNKSKNFTKAVLTIDKTLKQVKGFALYDKNGNTFTYKVLKYLTDVPVRDSDFTFDTKQFPGAEVIDMR